MKNEFSMPAFAWILLTLLCLALILAGLKATLKKTGWEKNRQRKIFTAAVAVISIWTVLLLLVSYSGFFSDFSKLPPRPVLVVLIPLPFIIWFAYSGSGTRLLRTVPPHWLVYMQSFRIAVELLLLIAFLNDRIPVQMTFEGRNFDIATGVLALPVGYLLAMKKPFGKTLAVTFNIIGLVSLLNILLIAVLSMPGPIRYFMNEPANTLVAQFPFILLPGVLVPVAYGFHILSFRQLVSKQTPVVERWAGQIV